MASCLQDLIHLAEIADDPVWQLAWKTSVLMLKSANKMSRLRYLCFAAGTMRLRVRLSSRHHFLPESPRPFSFLPDILGATVWHPKAWRLQLLLIPKKGAWVQDMQAGAAGTPGLLCVDAAIGLRQQEAIVSSHAVNAS